MRRIFSFIFFVFSTGVIAASAKPLTSDEICVNFQGPVQTWQSNVTGVLSFSGWGGTLSGTPDGRIGFKIVNKENSNGVNGSAQYPCVPEGSTTVGNGVQCVSDPSLMVSDIPFRPFNESIPDGTLRKGNVNAPSSTGALTIDPDYYDSIVADGADILYLNAGYYNTTVMKVGAGAKVYVNGPVIIETNHLEFGGGGYINYNPNDLSSTVASDLVITIENNSEGSNDATMIGGGSGSIRGYIALQGDMKLNGQGIIYGAVLARNIDIGSSPHVVYEKKDSCILPDPDSTYTLDVTPDNQFALLCQAPKVTYTVYNEDGTIATDYPGTITATYPSGLTPLDPTVGSKNSNYIYQHNKGVVTVPVKSDTLAEYTIKAELTGLPELTYSPEQKDSGLLNFVPFKFDIDDLHVIANQPEPVIVSVLACNSKSSEPQLVKNYQGKPTVATTLEEPKPSNVDSVIGDTLIFEPNFNDKNNTDGETQANLTFQDSGKVSMYLKDTDFDCTGVEGCPIDDGGTGVSILQGMFTVYSRPWTFAICSASNEDMTGTAMVEDSEYTQAFRKAGSEFDLLVKPLRWVDGAGRYDPQSNKPPEINVARYCEQFITKNFTLYDKTINVQVTHGMSSEVKDNGGRIGILSGNKSKQISKENSNNEYDFFNLSWSEVGVLRLQADTDVDYYNMDINLGYRDIGRFYPHHLEIEGNQWDYLPDYSGFAYMNQPFPMEYTVVAVNKDGEETQNYGFFDSSLQDELALTAINNDNGQSLLNRLIYTNQSTNGWSDLLTNGKTTERNAQYVVHYDDFKFSKKLGSNPNNSEYTSTSDGPYDSTNAKFGVAVIKKVDDVDFDFTSVDSGDKITLDADGDDTVDIGLKFTLQPDFRYGRMTLDSVSGPIGGPINVPLRVEYWDGSSFITNTDDSGSEFKTRVYYVMSNLQDSSAKFSDVGTSKVTNGKSSVLKAEQSTHERETVRLFLRQGNDSTGYKNSPKPADDPDLNATIKDWINPEDIGQPWLQFNWRNLGDEDPSTTVIFGAYRGNDRIIYRGEPNLTAN
ncbi:MAG: DUF6701 domain-containing protein [Vibrio hibernica]